MLFFVILIIWLSFKIRYNILISCNFKELCILFSKHHIEFEKKYMSNSTNHTSWAIQNYLINICASYVRDSIVSEVKKCGMFSISCDEAR